MSGGGAASSSCANCGWLATNPAKCAKCYTVMCRECGKKLGKCVQCGCLDCIPIPQR